MAALRVHRRHGRGLPRPVAPGDRRQRQPLQRERRRRHRPHAGARRARPRRRPSTRRPPGLAWSAGDALVLRRAAAAPTGPSRWRGRAGRPSGATTAPGGSRRSTSPRTRRRVRFVAALVAAQVARRRRRALVHAVHDVSGGGLAVALAEMAAAAGVGCAVDAVDDAGRALHRAAVALRGGHGAPDELCCPGRRAGRSRPRCSAGPAASASPSATLVDLPVDGACRGLRGEPGPGPGRTVMPRACARMGGA